MLYQHLHKEKAFIGDPDIEDENSLRDSLYEQALDDLNFNRSDYFEEQGAFELSKMLDVLKISIHGSIDDVIKTFEQVWGDTIILVDEDTICPHCESKQEEENATK